jgi:SSS family solute:Na+ symporter
LIAVLLVIIIAGSATWIGLTSAQLFPEASAGDQVLPHFIQALFPVGLKGLILVGLLAAVMSTADICILTVSANVSRDIYQRFIHPEVGNATLLRISITTSLVVGLLAGMMAWRMQDVIDILLIGFTINGAALVIPTVAAIYWEQTDAKAAFWSIAGGLVTVLIWQVIGSNTALPYFEIDPLWPGLTVATAIFVIGHRGRAPWHSPDRLNAGSN